MTKQHNDLKELRDKLPKKRNKKGVMIIRSDTKEFKDYLKELEKMNPDLCPECGKKIVPDLKAVRFGTKKWDGHSYKFNCKCFRPNLRLCKG